MAEIVPQPALAASHPVIHDQDASITHPVISAFSIQLYPRVSNYIFPADQSAQRGNYHSSSRSHSNFPINPIDASSNFAHRIRRINQFNFQLAWTQNAAQQF